MGKREAIRNIELLFEADLKTANNLIVLKELKVKYLGKKGLIPELFKTMKTIDVAVRQDYGALINNLREQVHQKLNEEETKLKAQVLKEQLEQEKIDVTLPGLLNEGGSFHPLTQTINLISELFVTLGYKVIRGPEIETDLYNFEYLNVPPHHPARAMQDTFYLTPEILLRTQTSPAQIRTLLGNKEPQSVRIICPGKVFRRDNDDATHSHQFMQIEGLVVAPDISLAHLKGTLEVLVRHLFGAEREVRFRPSYFPFTEPSIEADVNCFKCEGKGCSLCKQTGWIEILGAGLVHPHVLERCGYDSEKWTGFAFGLGVERIAMLRYGITDIRDFYTNDLRFLKQFDQYEGGF